MGVKKRVFVGMTEISGYYSALVFGLRSAGYEVTFFGGNRHPFSYSCEKYSGINWIYDYIVSKKIGVSDNSFFRKNFWKLLRLIVFPAFFIFNVCRHEVFIFGFATSFHPSNRDLFFLNRMGKRIVSFVNHGSDSRPPCIDGSSLYRKEDRVPYSDLRVMTKRMSQKLARIEKYSHVVVAAPLTSQFLKKSFVNTCSLGFSVGLDHKTVKHRESLNSGEIRILHAPSNRRAKGSDIIFEAVESVRKKRNINISYIEISGLPHDRVLDELSRCDFVVDQLYSDFPMAAFAAEAAWHAKPAIVGGYGWHILKKVISEEDLPPTHLCKPEEIEGAIDLLVTNKEYRNELGSRAHNFISKKWCVEEYTKKIKLLLETDPLTEWMVDPNNILYMDGCGVSRKESQEAIREYISLYGIDAMEIDKYPYVRFLNDLILQTDK